MIDFEREEETIEWIFLQANQPTWPKRMSVIWNGKSIGRRICHRGMRTHAGARSETRPPGAHRDRTNHLLRLRYRNKDRVVEPHDYGQHKGVIKLLTWQIGGSSSGPLPNWRWMEIDRSPMRRCSTKPLAAPAPRLPANTTNGTNSFSESNRAVIGRTESPASALHAPLPKAHYLPYARKFWPSLRRMHLPKASKKALRARIPRRWLWVTKSKSSS